MNKIILALAVISLSLGGCVKDRVCNCTVPASESIPEQKFIYKLDETKKKKAKNACGIADDTYKLQGGKCELE